MLTRKRYAMTMAGLGLFALASAAFGLLIGSTGWLWPSADQHGPRPWALIEAVRLPRVLIAFTVGGLLGLSGNLMQLLLRNPLADPYVLGLSAWSSLGALIGLAWVGGGLGLSAGALTGAALAALTVWQLARRELGAGSSRLILSGVALGALATAGLTLVLYFAPDERLRGMVFWLMGDLGRQGQVWFAAAVLATCLMFIWPKATSLNQWLLGEELAASYGVRVVRLRRHLLAAACVSAAAAVTLAGPIGFIGLIVPHTMRLWLGHDQRLALPAVVLAGGAFLVLADALARSVAAPLQLPVGVVMVVLGVPWFLTLLWRRAP